MTTIIIREKIGNVDINGATLRCLKHLKRYGEFSMPKDVMREILLCALKGLNCKIAHLDIAERDSIYEYLRDKTIDDPYLQNFMRKSKEILRKND